MKYNKTKFVFTLLALFFPIISFYIFLLSQPIDQFAFRFWDTLSVKNESSFLPGAFYPNTKLSRNEVGDLAPYTNDAVIRHVEVEIDEFGFRNRKHRCSDPDIIFIGDSMVVGSGITQDKTLPVLVEKKLGRCVYSFGGADFEKAWYFIKKYSLKPRSIVIGNVERYLSILNPYNEKSFSQRSKKLERFYFENENLRIFFSNLSIFIERVLYNGFQNFKSKHGIISSFKRMLTSPSEASLKNENLNLPQKMIFYNGESALEPFSTETFRRIEKTYVSYREVLASNKIKLYVLIVPNKETIYPNLIPSSRKSYNLGVVYTLLEKNHISFVNLERPFSEKFLFNNEIVYYSDDTHWNEDGIAVASEILSQQIQADFPKSKPSL